MIYAGRQIVRHLNAAIDDDMCFFAHIRGQIATKFTTPTDRNHKHGARTLAVQRSSVKKTFLLGVSLASGRAKSGAVGECRVKNKRVKKTRG